MYNRCQEKPKTDRLSLADETRRRLSVLATTYKNKELLDILQSTDSYINFNYTPVNSYSALTRSVLLRNPEMVNLLINNGADVNRKDGYNNTPLTLALSLKDEGMVKILIEKCPDVNLPDKNGETLLMRAIRLGKEGEIFFDMLIENGADINLSNKNGETALSIAQDIQNEHMVTSLKKHENCNETQYLAEGKYLYNLSRSVNNEPISVCTATAIGNVSESSELQPANLDRIAHHVSTVDSDLSPAINSSGWITVGLGAAGVGVGLVAGIYYIHRVFGQTRTYNKSIQTAQLSSVGLKNRNFC